MNTFFSLSIIVVVVWHCYFSTPLAKVWQTHFSKTLPAIFTTMRIFLLFLILTAHLANSQELIEPLQLSERIFSKSKFKQLKKYTTGEYLENKNRPNGTDLSTTIDTEFELLTKQEKISVVAMTLLDSKGKQITNIYLHFKLEDMVWKLAAFRGIAMTGLIEQIVQMYDSLNEQQIDSLLSQENSGFQNRA